MNILYKECNSSASFQSTTIENSQLLLNNLTSATAYEIKFEVSNNSSNLQSESYYFTTKALNIDYEKFFSDYNISSPYETFAHLNKNFEIQAEGISDFNEVEVYLVNDQKTDSLQLTTTINDNTLSFTIPNDYLSQNPRESVKKAFLGIKIKDSYEYLLNEIAWFNINNNSSGNNPDESNLKFKIFNDTPYIQDYTLNSGSQTNCPNYTLITFNV